MSKVMLDLCHRIPGTSDCQGIELEVTDADGNKVEKVEEQEANETQQPRSSKRPSKEDLGSMDINQQDNAEEVGLNVSA